MSQESAFTVLIVDDDAINLVMLERIVAKCFTPRVLKAGSGFEALDIVRSDAEVDLLLMDVQMPGMDGFETLQKIKEIPGRESLPVIFITAYDPAERLRERSFDVGGIDYITKPVDHNSLVARLKMYARFIAREKRAGQAREDSRRMFETMLSSIPEALWCGVADRKGGFVCEYVSPAVERIAGTAFAAASFTPSDWLKVVHPDDRGRLNRAIDDILYGEKAEFAGEYRVVAPDGEVRWVLGSASVHVLAHGVRRICGVLTDISARKRAEEEAEERKARLGHADKMKSLAVLVSGVAHEINNPNHFISLNLPLLRGIWADSLPLLREVRERRGPLCLGGMDFAAATVAFEELLEGIEEGSERIKTLVSSLKDLSRRDVPAKLLDIDLNLVLKGALALLGDLPRQSTRHFEVSFGKDLPMVKGDARRLEQAMVNLVQNACQSLDSPEARIAARVYAAADGSGVVFEVEDEGRGIPAAVLRHVTDPFFTTRREVGGTGLGLYLCAEIVNAHKGVLSFESEPGKGTLARMALRF